MSLTRGIARAGVLILAAAGLSIDVMAAQVPAAPGKVESCIDPNTRALISCDSPSPTSTTASGLNPAVSAAAANLGQALGQALIRSLFSRPNQSGPSAPPPDSAAVAEAMRRAQFAHDKTELLNALGMSDSDGTTLRMAGDAPAQLQLTGPPGSGELRMADAPTPLPPLSAPQRGPTPPDVVATIQLRVGDTSLLVAAPKNAAGIDIPFAVCSFATDNAGVVTVNAATGLMTAVGTGAAHIIETCNGGAARAAVAVAVRARLLRLQLVKAGDGDGRLSAMSAGRDFESGLYEEGALVTVTADPVAVRPHRSTFGGWRGPCETQTARTCTVTMNADKTIVAVFDPAPR